MAQIASLSAEKWKAGGQAEVIICHAGNLKEINDLFERIKDTYDRLDILINNAATNPYFGEMIDADEKAWDKTNEVNLKGPFFITQHAARLMKKSGGGAIVNVAAISGGQPIPKQGIYSITKAGLTETHFSEIFIKNESILKYALQHIPMRRHAQPAEMAGAVLYLLSDAASSTTGACSVCDGGAPA